MKVLVVARAGTGGAGRHVLDVTRALAPRHEMRLLASPLEDPRFLEALAATGAKVLPLPLARGVDPARDVSAVAAVRKAIAGFCPDVVHAHAAKPGALARAAAGRTPVVYSPHGFFHHYPTATSWARRAALLVERRLAGRTAVLAVCSEHERIICEAEGLQGRQGTVVVPNGVHPAPDMQEEDVRAVRRELGIEDNEALVLMAARLAAPKEPRVFLEAAAAVPAARFVLAGDGPELARCRRAAPGNAVLTGVRDDVPLLLAAADVAVLATRYEAGPYFVVEAMAAGVPVVVTDLPTTREMVGEAGVLAPPGDAVALAKEISGVLADPSRQEDLRGRSRQRAMDAYSVEKMAAATEEAWALSVSDHA